MARLKILQLFSRYLQYGGEEGIVYRTGDALQSIHDVDYFIASTEELLQQPRLAIPALTYRNFPVLKRLVEHQRQGEFDFWQIHNVFPAISPGAYTLAKKLDIPIVHYLHNYRMVASMDSHLLKGKTATNAHKEILSPESLVNVGEGVLHRAPLWP